MFARLCGTVGRLLRGGATAVLGFMRSRSVHSEYDDHDQGEERETLDQCRKNDGRAADVAGGLRLSRDAFLASSVNLPARRFDIIYFAIFPSTCDIPDHRVGLPDSTVAAPASRVMVVVCCLLHEASTIFRSKCCIIKILFQPNI